MNSAEEFVGELHIIKEDLADKIDDLVDVLNELEALLIKCGLTTGAADKGKDAVDLAFDQIVEDTVFGEGA